MNDNWKVTAPLFALALAAHLAAPAAGANDHVGYNLERGEPRRWQEPLATPRERYENAMLEARNALAEEIRQCRRGPRPERKRCEAQARAEHDREVAEARRVLLGGA